LSLRVNEKIFFLGEDLWFPDPLLAPDDAPLAFGGDLSTKRLSLAYYEGIFPWFNNDSLLLWWSPNPRCVIFPNDYRVNKTLRRFIRRYRVEFDRDFDLVISSCANRKETWITPKMRQAYNCLHQSKKAHCVSVYEDEQLVGGVYGVCVGDIFCGESMFSLRPNASKVALWALMYKFSNSLRFIDCQVPNPHLLSLGAKVVERKKFLKLLKEGRDNPCPFLLD